MPLFRKIITRPNVYSVKTPQGRRIKAVSKQLLADVADTGNKMIEAGLNIPAPYAHKDGHNIVPSPLGKDEKPTWSANFNAGFWKKFELTPAGELAGYIEVENEDDAKKIGKSIKETSVWLEPEFTDGLGRKWKNALRHVALVTNAVEPDQENFQLVDTSPEYSLAMAFCMSDAVDAPKKDGDGDGKTSEGSAPPADTSKENPKSDDASKDDPDTDQINGGNVPEIVSLLKDKLGYELPTDTTPENFLDRLRTLLTSIKKEEEEEEDLATEKQPKEEEKSQAKPSPVTMANENPDNVVLLEKLQKQAQKFTNKMLEDLKADLTKRVEAVVAAGKLSKKAAEELFLTPIQALTMSLEDLDEEGNIPKLPIQDMLVMAESMSGLLDDNDYTKPNVGNVQHMQENPQDVMTAEEKEQFFRNAGL
jgi:hypothetical protein